MNKSVKKMLAVLLSLITAATLLSAGAVAFGEDLIAVDENNFSDPVFRKVLLTDDFDKDGDGFLSAAERSITAMQLSGRIDIDTESIKTLDGIKYFPSLTVLRCGGIGLESLDTAPLVNLEILSCQGNELSELNLISNYSLVSVDCSGNRLENLSLPFDSAFETLQCYSNNLTSIDLSGLSGLTVLRCDQNSLSSIDLSANTMLDYINCSYNKLTSLDLSKTALQDVTDYEIGNQEITLKAQPYGAQQIIVPFSDHGLTADNYRGCSLDSYGNGSGFNFNGFVANEVSEIDGGIVYECYPMLASAENMSVNVTVERSFYQINFYRDSEKTELLGKRFVNGDETAAAPEITDVPQCKAFDKWSESIVNPDSDRDVYIIWKDEHTYAPSAIADDNDTVTVSCNECGAGYDVSFASLINTTTSDGLFDVNIDVVKDGYINAKDYAKLLRDLK